MKKLLVVSVLFVATAAHAESLEERKYWKGEMEYLNRSIEAAQKSCDTKFSFDWVDKPKFREATEKEGSSPYGVCAAVIDEVESLCREGDDEKASVKAGIKGFQCGYAKPRKLDLSKRGILKYMGNNEEANFSDWAKPWITKHL
ncbi:MAG TPA: hypothetical protein VL326_21750 [Kofleriaceae bacterium]|jgi:hypothetical protein|nr:hypothetical protein [Kofleriaceae bacterium]